MTAAKAKSKPVVETKVDEGKPVDVNKLASDVADLSSAMERMLDLMETRMSTPVVSPVVSTVEPADIASVSTAASEKAKPNRVTTNPEWEEMARDILGESLDHTEVEHERSGGIKFTVVIKRAFSNADQQYLDLVKVDRRTKEVSQDGISGVEEWCRQIKANLTRMTKITARQ